MSPNPEIIDDLSLPPPRATNGASWELITDTVMGGVSRGTMRREEVAGRAAIRLVGDVSLENNGGFIQMALDLAGKGGVTNARAWTGVEIDVFGNGERYNVHLRTADVARPWQSYRHEFLAAREWRRLRLPFTGFEAHRIDVALDPGKLRRIGIVAIGHAFRADLAIGGLRFYA